VWLSEAPWLRQLLDWFLDRLNTPRSQAITRRVNKSTIPALYDFAEDTRARWKLIELLQNEYQVFTIGYDKRIALHQERYENAQLRLNPASESLLRDWLERPREDPATEIWRRAVAAHATSFQDQGTALLSARPSMPGCTPIEIVAAFATISELLQHPLSLREISARCFWGSSKFLDQRHELLTSLFGEEAATIQPRPLLLTAWAPSGFTRLLIVENQDSFLRLVDAPPPDYALVFSGGFRASASRLSSEYTRFAFLPGSDSQRFQEMWLTPHCPAYFWGDLDFAGLGILKALRQPLPQLQAWQNGYQPMLELLRNGLGHLPEQAEKTRQIDPGQTGCVYSDSVLLPELRSKQLFLDQEAVRISLLPWQPGQ
jgi:hypothetical protein